MKIVDTQLEYDVKFEKDEEVVEFVEWCVENKDMIDTYRVHCFSSGRSKCGSVTFTDMSAAMGFKLRWS